MSVHKNLMTPFVNELFFRSGSFGVFYIFMNFFQSGMTFFKNDGHLIFLIAIFSQSLLIARFDLKGKLRIASTLIAPFAYTVAESIEGINFALNAAHIFVWVFSIVAAVIIYVEENGSEFELREKVCNALLIILNVSSFLLVFFYTEMKTILTASSVNGVIDPQLLRLDSFLQTLPSLVFDAQHAYSYLVFGATILTFAIIIEKNLLLDIKNRIKLIFGSYVDEELSKLILSDSLSQSDRTNVAVLFADIRNFTSLSEHRDAQEVMDMLNIYYQHWFHVSKQYGGIIDKYIGDGIMLWWRLDEGKGASLATECAQMMLKEMEHVTYKLEQKKLPVIRKIGIGISVGEVILGNVGHDKRKEYTCIGDTVNTASRLESLSKELQTDIVIADDMYQYLSEDTKKLFARKERKAVKGKGDEIDVRCFSVSL